MWFLTSRQDTQETWAYAPKVFTKEQCEQIINLGESLLPDTARTDGGVCPDVRDSKVSWIQPSQESVWLFRHMTDVVTDLNKQFFRFDLDGFGEGFQFTKYEPPAGKYDVHIDKSYGKGTRYSLVSWITGPAFK